MKKAVFLLALISLFLTGCQPISEWKTVDERNDSWATQETELFEPVSLAFQTTSFLIQSAVQKENQLLVSIEWQNEGNEALTFSERYTSFSVYQDDKQLTLSKPALFGKGSSW